MNQRPAASTCSPAETDGVFPTTVARSFLPLTFTRKTAKPDSGLWKVTRSMNPCRVSGINLSPPSVFNLFLCPLHPLLGGFRRFVKFIVGKISERQPCV